MSAARDVEVAEVDEQQKQPWLARWRAKRQSKRHRTVSDSLFGGVDGDSAEKIAQRHTSRGTELEAEDRAGIVKGSTGGGG